MNTITAVINEVYTWEGEDGSKRIWNVELLKSIIASLKDQGRDLEPAEMTMEQAKQALHYNKYKRDPERIAKAVWKDRPILAVTVWNERTQKEEALIIDGWHRIDKYVLDNPSNESLQCYILGKDGSDALERLTAEMGIKAEQFV